VEDVDVKVNKILAKYAAKLGKSVPILYWLTVTTGIVHLFIALV
jgi:hypothetical protein